MSHYNYLRGQRDKDLAELRGFAARLNLTVNVEVKDALIKEAKAQGLSVSTLSCNILNDWLEEKNK